MISIFFIPPQQHLLLFHHTRPAHTDIHFSNLSILEDIPDHLPPYFQYTHNLLHLTFYAHSLAAALISIAV